jgi:hypothetical protein
MKHFDRTEHINEITNLLDILSKNDLRIGQIFEIIRTQSPDNNLFTLENDHILQKLNNLTNSIGSQHAKS